MQNCLVVINSYFKDQLDTHVRNEIESETMGFSLFSLTRTKIAQAQNNFALFEEGFNRRQRNLPKVTNSQLETLADIIGEELNFDRDFLTHGDFSLIGRNSSPKNLALESRFIASKIAEVIETVNPVAIVPGHPDNWLSSAMFRIAKTYGIPTGFALETFYGSRKALIIDDFSYNNSKVPIGLFESKIANKLVETSGSESILEANEHFHLSFGNIPAKSFYTYLRNLAVTEAKSVFEIFWRTQRGLERWMLVDQVLPGVNTLRFIQRNLFSRVRKLRYFKELDLPDSKNGRKKGIVFLHLSPEAAQLTFCREYVNQVEFVKRIISMFGREVDIYVKEHPLQEIGYRSKNFYKELIEAGAQLIPINSNFNEISQLPGLKFIATLHGTVAFHCAENKIFCVLGEEKSFHKNLPYTKTLSTLNKNEILFPDTTVPIEFSVNEMWEFLEKSGVVIDYRNDISGQLQLARVLVDESTNNSKLFEQSVREGE